MPPEGHQLRMIIQRKFILRKQQKQETLTLSSDETVRLEGGLSQTGRPAELVRIKNGKAISLSTGAEFQPQPNPAFDTSMEDGVDDLTRSMARRRKSSPTVVKNVECSECQKQFKRPCDLTWVSPI